MTKKCYAYKISPKDRSIESADTVVRAKPDTLCWSKTRARKEAKKELSKKTMLGLGSPKSKKYKYSVIKDTKCRGQPI